MSFHAERTTAELQRLAAEYLSRVGAPPGGALLTVTGVALSTTGDRAKIFLSVWPTDQAEAALEMAKRHLAGLRQHVSQHLITKKIPFLDFALAVENK